MGATLSTLYTTASTPIQALSTRYLPPARQVPTSVHEAEARLLSQLCKTRYEKRAVRLPSGHILNTLSAGSQTNPTLVVVHGWGSGSAFFGKNIDGLSEKFRVHFVDWLGFGASSRPDHRLDNAPIDAENFFIEALAEWVSEMKMLEAERFRKSSRSGSITPFHLCGHSMGAYLSVAFSLRYPDLVKNLVLASPVGLPKAPLNKMPPPTAPLRKRVLFWVLFTLWERGWTPQSLLRMSGRRVGRRVSSWMIDPRFPAKCVGAREALSEYFYEISCARPSGEYSLSTILESGAYARLPLCDRMKDVSVPVTFLYGDRDWMSVEVAEGVVDGMKVEAEVHVVDDAGHHLYYDNADDFNRLVSGACAGL